MVWKMQKNLSGALETISFIPHNIGAFILSLSNQSNDDRVLLIFLLV